MSKGKDCCYEEKPVCCCGNFGSYGNKSCCCNLPTIIVLILIILQFGRKGRTSSGSGKLVDNSLLFIIALFYLSCCNPCKGMA